MKPILFNQDMVRAILDGRKTVTRRVVRPPALYAIQEDESGKCVGSYYEDDHAAYLYPTVDDCPYQPNSIMYVRETWAAWSRTMGTPPALYYKADKNTPDGIKWRPSIHMPREAARLFLRVTDVRISRLQWCGNMESKEEGCTCCSQFARIWDSTIKKSDRALYGWDANPWVWVIEFERISKEGAMKC